jgi:acyl-CoA dehydrogenase
MNLELTEEQEMLIGSVRRFVREEIVPLEASLDPDAYELPQAEHRRLSGVVKEMGLFGLGIPPEHGGPDVDMVTRALLAIEMSQHRAGIYAPCYGTFGGTVLAQLYEANEDQKQRYLEPLLRGEVAACFALTEPSGGSDPAGAILTRAVRDGEDWIINGSKIFISGADKSDFCLVFARTGDPNERGSITAFIVDTDSQGFEVRRVVHTLRSSHYATELEFVNLRVPHRNVLGGVGQGLKIANDRLSRNRIPYAAECLGAAIRAQELAVDHAKQRVTFGQPLAHRQAIQWMLVDNEIDIRHARWMILDAAFRCDRRQPFRTEAAIAKLVASEAAGRVVDRCIQIFGGHGVTKDLPFERWYRELRIRRVGEGPSEVQRILVAREILGTSPR